MPERTISLGLCKRIPTYAGIAFVRLEFEEREDRPALFGRLHVVVDEIGSPSEHVLRMDFGKPTFLEGDLAGLSEAQVKFLQTSHPSIMGVLEHRNERRKRMNNLATEFFEKHKAVIERIGEEAWNFRRVGVIGRALGGRSFSDAELKFLSDALVVLREIERVRITYSL